jgi:hypothetical protein
LQEASNLDDLILTEVAGPIGAEGNDLAVDGDGPVAIVRLVHITKTLQQDADVMPLDVVIEWVSEDLLDGDAVVVIQLD